MQDEIQRTELQAQICKIQKGIEEETQDRITKSYTNFERTSHPHSSIALHSSASRICVAQPESQKERPRRISGDHFQKKSLQNHHHLPWHTLIDGTTYSVKDGLTGASAIPASSIYQASSTCWLIKTSSMSCISGCCSSRRALRRNICSEECRS